MKEKSRKNVHALHANGYPPDFEQFWQAYPKPYPMPKSAAYRAWLKTAGSRPALSVLLAAVEAWKASSAALRARGEFVPLVPHASTWLNDERWDVEMDAPAAAAPVAPRESVAPSAEEAAEVFERACARGSWVEVLEARAARSVPLGGFHHARTHSVLAAIGGWPALDGATAPRLRELELQFIAAWLRPAAAAAADGRVVALADRRVGNG